jgi:hypothetical protein
VLLTTEMQTAIAAAARLDVDLRSIVEHTRTLAPRPHHQCELEARSR